MSHAADPATHEPALAGSLDSLSIWLAEAGQHDEGLAAISGLGRERGRLFGGDPDSHEEM